MGHLSVKQLETGGIGTLKAAFTYEEGSDEGTQAEIERLRMENACLKS